MFPCPVGPHCTCSCCGIDLNEGNMYRTNDDRTWCNKHGPLAVSLEAEALWRGINHFTMPGPCFLAARASVKRNNRLRHI